MAKIGIAVIGISGVGRTHLNAVAKTPGFELRGVCDVNAAAGAACAKELDVKAYTDHQAMFKADPKIRAVSIATPHWFHPPIAVDAAKAGVHVLTEKPMAVTVAGADRMIAAHKKAKTILAVVYQQRFVPAKAKARDLVAKGKLGRINRTMLIAGDYRTNAYYASAGWRATWRGEGGGVLLNQAPHDLDLFQWITGLMPAEVFAKTETKMHPIEVEDCANALLWYKNGAIGYLYSSTCEIPREQRFEISGDLGKLILEGGSLKFARLKQDLRKFTATTKKAWSQPDVEWEDVKLPEAAGAQGHVAVYHDFLRAIRTGKPPAVTGEDGRNSVELANAMILSSFTGKPVKVPVNRKAYEALMRKLIAQSKKKAAKKK
ncbi:MAG: Gfo/Idh/MocA family oxidoreductase [Planctomycetota bacterium]|nr:Gfo/Idh/MocA family oxidoreductase [Planctomycetota bacterium]